MCRLLHVVTERYRSSAASGSRVEVVVFILTFEILYAY